MPEPTTETPVPTPTTKGSIDARLANLRPASDLAKTCSQCAHYEPGWGGCRMVAADRIRPDYVCDLFIATTLEAEAADDDEHGYAMKGSAALGITKADDAEQNVFGWAYVSKRADGEQVTDHSGEQVAPADLEAAAYEFVVESRKAGDRHQGDAVGVMVESMVFTPEKLAKMGLPADALPTGWWVGFHLPDAADYELVKSGDRAMFSIEGTAVRVPVEE